MERECPVKARIELYLEASKCTALALTLAQEQGVLRFAKEGVDLRAHYGNSAYTMRMGCLTKTLCRRYVDQPCELSKSEYWLGKA